MGFGSSKIYGSIIFAVTVLAMPSATYSKTHVIDASVPTLDIGTLSSPNPAFERDRQQAGLFEYKAKAIARWNVIPFQKIDNEIQIGVVAFHMNGISHIDFSANGGHTRTVRVAKLNFRTNVLEYSVQLKTSDIKDQKITLKATAFPLSGSPRTLEPLVLWANAKAAYGGNTVYVTNQTTEAIKNGTKEHPFTNIASAIRAAGSGGDVILLDRGKYSLEGNAGIKKSKSWITIKADDGIDRDDIILELAERKLVRLGTDKLKFQNLSIDFGSFIQIYPENKHLLWFDNVRWFDSNRSASEPEGQILIPIRTSKYIGGYYVTNSICENTLYGFVDAKLVRNSRMENISGDALQRSLMILNVSIHDMDGDLRKHHSDILQYFGDFDNVIVFGLWATKIKNVQNIFLDHYKSSFQNMAFVNIAIENISSDPPFSQLNARQNHVLFYHLSIPGQTLILRDDFTQRKKFVPKDVIVMNSIFKRITRGKHSWKGIPVGIKIYSSHFVTGEKHGNFPTSGPIKINQLQSGRITYQGSQVSAIIQSGIPMQGFMISSERVMPKSLPDRGFLITQQ